MFQLAVGGQKGVLVGKGGGLQGGAERFPFCLEQFFRLLGVLLGSLAGAFRLVYLGLGPVQFPLEPVQLLQPVLHGLDFGLQGLPVLLGFVGRTGVFQRPAHRAGLSVHQLLGQPHRFPGDHCHPGHFLPALVGLFLESVLVGLVGLGKAGGQLFLGRRPVGLGLVRIVVCLFLFLGGLQGIFVEGVELLGLI